MGIDYSTIDTIENYDTLFRKFHDYINNYEALDSSSKLIYLTAGLGLSNSIHERFIKSIFEEYGKLHELSKTKKQKAINSYKAPKKVISFVTLLELDLNEAFELNKIDIQQKFALINTLDNLMDILNNQREIRNDYLHGDFNFNDEIVFDIFNQNIIQFQEIHNFILKIIRYSFIKNIDVLPNISNKL